VNLTQALGIGLNSPLDGGPCRATMLVDQVRVWR
jgi:hypothetical protein